MRTVRSDCEEMNFLDRMIESPPETNGETQVSLGESSFSWGILKRSNDKDEMIKTIT